MKHTCPNCQHTWETAKKAKPVATLSIPDPAREGWWLSPPVLCADGQMRQFGATFPHDEKRYQAIVRKHKAANDAKLRRARELQTNYIDSCFR